MLACVKIVILFVNSSCLPHKRNYVILSSKAKPNRKDTTMGNNIQIELTNGEVLEITEYDLDELALQAKYRMKADAWGSQSGYDLYCMCKNVFVDYFEVRVAQETTINIEDECWGDAIKYIAENSLDASRMALMLMQRIDIIIE